MLRAEGDAANAAIGLTAPPEVLSQYRFETVWDMRQRPALFPFSNHKGVWSSGSPL
jgi:hypothetical protein